MPAGWKPGMPALIPDPENPGRMIEIPADAFEIKERPPSIGADLDENEQQKPKRMKKKKKKKKLVTQLNDDKDKF